MSQLPGITTCYGVDVEGGHAVVVRATATRRGPVHEVLWDDELGDGDPRFAKIARLISTSDAVVAAGVLPVREAVTRWLTTPFPSVRKAKKVFPSLLDIQLPFPLENCICDFLEVERAGDQVRALAVAAKKDALERRLELYREIGVDLVILDHEGLALWAESVRELPPEPEGFRVVAFVGYEHSALVIGRGQSLQSVHPCGGGLRQLLGAGDGAVDAGTMQDFVGRAKRVVMAERSETGENPIQWAWTGPGADSPSLREAIGRELDRSVSVNAVVHEAPRTFLARAIATRAVAAGPLGCNLRMKELEHPRASALRSGLRLRVAMAYVALGLFLCALNLAWWGLLSYREAKVQARVTELARELTGIPNPPKDKEVLVAQRAMEQTKPLSSAFVRAFEPSLMELLAQILKTAEGRGIMIGTLSLRDDYISLHGTSEDYADSQALTAALEKRGFVVELDRQDAVADERVRFSIQGGESAQPRVISVKPSKGGVADE